jgi:hypothetical protein
MIHATTGWKAKLESIKTDMLCCDCDGTSFIPQLRPMIFSLVGKEEVQDSRSCLVGQHTSLPYHFHRQTPPSPPATAPLYFVDVAHPWKLTRIWFGFFHRVRNSWALKLNRCLPLAAVEVEVKQSLCVLKRLDFGVAEHATDELYLGMLVAAGEEVVKVVEALSFPHLWDGSATISSWSHRSSEGG